MYFIFCSLQFVGNGTTKIYALTVREILGLWKYHQNVWQWAPFYFIVNDTNQTCFRCSKMYELLGFVWNENEWKKEKKNRLQNIHTQTHSYISCSMSHSDSIETKRDQKRQKTIFHVPTTSSQQHHQNGSLISLTVEC